MRDGRVSGVELSDHDGAERLEAEYVFACDGRFSVLRQAAGLDQPRLPEFFDIVWFKIPMPEFYRNRPLGIRGYVGNGHLGLFIPAYDDLLQVGWIIRKGSFSEFREDAFEVRIEEIAGQVSADMAGHLRRHAGDATHPFLLDVVCDDYDEWSAPGMLLIGDAAHPMSPVGAQGINIALRDAVVAANHFVPALLAGADPAALDAAAADYHDERKKEIQFIQAAQRRIPRVMFSTSILLDLVFPVVRGLSALGFTAWALKKADFRRNPFFAGCTEVKLKV